MSASLRCLFAALALLGVLNNAGWAFPSLGSDCSSCHTSQAGAFNVLPSDLIKLFPGQTDQVTLDVTDIPSGSNAAFGIVGLSATGLNATAGAGWTPRSNASGNWVTSASFNTLGQRVLQLTLGANAMLGQYPITARLAGATDAGEWSTTRNFTIEVVPEPAVTALLGIALASAVLAWRRKRSVDS